MNETVKDRLIQYLEYRNIKIGTFERSIGAPNGYMKSVKYSPNKYLEQIYATYPDLDRVWLLSGEKFEKTNDTPEGSTKDGFVSEDIEGNNRVQDLIRHINTLQDQLKEKDMQINSLIKIIENGRAD